jgi:ribosomal subunit interface protein
MNLDVRIHKTDLAEALRDYIERRLRFALGRVGGSVERVTARVADLNGPRGGQDKRCTISAAVSPAGIVVVEETDSDLYAAINRAAERAGRTILRHLQRAREARTFRETTRKPPRTVRRPYSVQR